MVALVLVLVLLLLRCCGFDCRGGDNDDDDCYCVCSSDKGGRVVIGFLCTIYTSLVLLSLVPE